MLLDLKWNYRYVNIDFSFHDFHSAGGQIVGRSALLLHLLVGLKPIKKIFKCFFFSKLTVATLLVTIFSPNAGNKSCAVKMTSLNVTVDNCQAVIQIPACQGQCASGPRWEAHAPVHYDFSLIDWLISHAVPGLIPPLSLPPRHVGSQRRRVARPPAGGARVPMLPGAFGRDEVSDPAVLGPHQQTARLQAHHRLRVPSLRHPEIKVWGNATEEGEKKGRIIWGKSFFSCINHHKNDVSLENNDFWQCESEILVNDAFVRVEKHCVKWGVSPCVFACVIAHFSLHPLSQSSK